jgi:hypothetical protein
MKAVGEDEKSDSQNGPMTNNVKEGKLKDENEE